jgi:hypothetical protein
VKCEIGKKIGALKKNCGGEFTFTTFNDYCQIDGIKRQLTQVLTPQENGVGKRGNCTIVEKAKNMVFSSGIPSFLWFKTINTLNNLVNIGPTHATKASLQNKNKDVITLVEATCQSLAHLWLSNVHTCPKTRS